MPATFARRALAIAALVAIAMAWPVPALGGEDHAAVVIKEGRGALLDGKGATFRTTNYHKVITQSRNGNVLFKLVAKGVPNGTGKAVHWDFNRTGKPCYISLENGEPAVVSPNWRETVSADGTAIFICHFKVPKKK